MANLRGNSMSVNIGPIAPSLPNIPRNPRADGLGHNPRCLRRDVNKNSAAVTTANYTYDLIVNNANTDRFQTVMEGEFNLGHWGVSVEFFPPSSPLVAAICRVSLLN